MTTLNNTNNSVGLRRGDLLPGGGRFIGQTRQSTKWVCYESGDAAFDSLYRKAHRRRAAVA